MIPEPPKPKTKNIPAAMEGEQYELWDVDEQPLPSEMVAAQPRYINITCRRCGLAYDGDGRPSRPANRLPRLRNAAHRAEAIVAGEKNRCARVRLRKRRSSIQTPTRANGRS